MAPTKDSDRLVCCVYVSSAAKAFTKDELHALLNKSRAKNLKVGITGMLLYHDGQIFHVLEGPDSVVNTLYDKIANDERHHSIVKLSLQEIDQRNFADYSMGHVHLSKEEAESIDGLNDILLRKELPSTFTNARIRKLFDVFKRSSGIR